ncbi:MAG: erythromycin esterase family protein [Metallibacterium scheffleri]|jgi:erythromycin esterase-like protein|uniref:erythromycin esterase family protein n=1 Tax=Metallibacterium scheffleri TaxID=993689 RepID=UPI0026EE4E79|nr:erythromycin esterase family protein [Metallibacterium scheffleri]MCK9366329.1 erythromycin esterase family protein [Metallibacterium scheffleri]
MTAPMTPFLATRELAQRLEGGAADYDTLLEMAADRRFVLLGEATHGTQEFYRMRAEITRRLIAEHGFDAVAVEADWPDAWRVNLYVQGNGDDDATSSLDDFERFPQWMWRNREVLDFVAWLRTCNTDRGPQARVGFYGLDLYSLYRSADAVIRYLQQVDPEQAEIARGRYAALDHVREPQVYGYQAAFGQRPAGREAAVAQLLQLRNDAQAYLERNGLTAIDAHFFAERNAAVVVNAETYYRAMFGRRVNTWNLRDAHMRDTLLALADYRIRRGGTGKVVVWAHNSHLGDARATEAHLRGEWNLGQLMRQDVGDKALLVGFTTYTGHVSAASQWDGDVEHKWVRPALHDSYEHLFHSTGLDRFFLKLNDPAAEPLRETMLERAIGVIYVPQTERASHYFVTSLAHQFDAVFHLDETAALEPLDAPRHWHRPEAVETAA